MGSPIGSNSFADAYVKKRVRRIQDALANLDLVDDPQVELLLIRSCLGFPKFAFTLRSAPPSQLQSAAAFFDDVLEEIFLMRFSLSLNEDQKSLLHLPVSHGGLGIIRASDVLFCAFLGNVLSSHTTVARLLQTPFLPLSSFPGAAEALAGLHSLLESPSSLPLDLAALPTAKLFKSPQALAHPQNVLTDLVHDHSKRCLLAKSSPPRETLHLLAVTRPNVADWSSVPPIRQLGYKFDREEFVTLLMWWLGIPIHAEGSHCPEPKCGSSMDRFGDHSAVCACGPSRNARHNSTNYSWAFLLKGFGLQCQTEVFTDPITRHRSADTLVNDWMHGRPCAHDWVITHVVQQGSLGGADPDWALKRAEAAKVSYAQGRCLKRGIDFTPLAADTFGGFGQLADSAIRIAVARGKLHRGFAGEFDLGVSVKAVKQRLRVSVMKGLARMLLRRLVVQDVVFEEPLTAEEPWLPDIPEDNEPEPDATVGQR